MPIIASPHIIERDGEKRCSVCEKVFENVGDLSISRAFIAHIREAHKSVPQPEKPRQEKSDN